MIDHADLKANARPATPETGWRAAAIVGLSASMRWHATVSTYPASMDTRCGLRAEPMREACTSSHEPVGLSMLDRAASCPACFPPPTVTPPFQEAPMSEGVSIVRVDPLDFLTRPPIDADPSTTAMLQVLCGLAFDHGRLQEEAHPSYPLDPHKLRGLEIRARTARNASWTMELWWTTPMNFSEIAAVVGLSPSRVRDVVRLDQVRRDHLRAAIIAESLGLKPRER